MGVAVTGTETVEGRADRYRSLAHQCLLIAPSLSNQQFRFALIDMARIYMRLANEQDRAEVIAEQACGVAMCVRPKQRLAKAEEPERAGSSPRGGGRLGEVKNAEKSPRPAGRSTDRLVDASAGELLRDMGRR